MDLSKVVRLSSETLQDLLRALGAAGQVTVWRVNERIGPRSEARLRQGGERAWEPASVMVLRVLVHSSRSNGGLFGTVS